MFGHPASVAGYIAVGGAAFMILASGGLSYREASLMMTLGWAIEAIGWFLILLGVIAQGFLRIERYLSGIPAMKLAFQAGEPQEVQTGSSEPWTAEGNTSSDPRAELERKLRERGLSR